jgi:beta-lactamase regulating signal transducer with metallopeptidase domain
MLYALLVGTLLASAARLLEGTLRIAGRPVRWVWATALGLTLALAIVAPARTTRDAISSDILERAKIPAGAEAIGASPSWGETLLATLRSAPLALAEPVARAFVSIERSVPPSIGLSLGITSMSLSALLLLLLAIVYVRFHRLRRQWPVAELLGERVRVSTRVGPAVVGLARPEIVIPSWLLSRTVEEQRLVLIHEREHVRAHDPLLLAAACAVAALMPWHPAVWWMLSRLRLAVELDCDVRVLRRGVAPRPYGTLLIDLAERCSGLGIGAAALTDASSHLEQRLLAMETRSSRFASLRASTLGAVAIIAIVAACEAKLPTSTDVENMNVASAEMSARKIRMFENDSGVTYYIDDVKATPAQAKALDAEHIGAIEVRKFAGGTPKAEVRIATRRPGDPALEGLHRKEARVELIGGEGSEMAASEKREMLTKEREFGGVLIVDGVRKNPSAMSTLDPNDIVSVEIVKGGNAASLYPAPEAAKGVIRITTKKGAAKK